MRIALVAPLYEKVPPQLYGGTERVTFWLTESLVDLGHDVTVYASGDSEIRARLIPCCKRALRLDDQRHDVMAAHFLQLERVVADASHYDIIHFHTDTFHFPFLRRITAPTLSTLHGRIDLRETQQMLTEYREENYIAISHAQEESIPDVLFKRTIHHGMPTGLLPFHPRGEGYLAFLGRISPEKGLHRAIEIARLAQKKIKVAAKIEMADWSYFQSISHLLKLPHVEFVGEISDGEKADFLGGADALLFPIDWPEPFGLTMIEAGACGTPVIAYPQGSVPEIIIHGRNGFLVDSIQDAVDAVERISFLSRSRCRSDFESRFSADRMARDHVNLYRQLCGERVTEWLTDLH